MILYSVSREYKVLSKLGNNNFPHSASHAYHQMSLSKPEKFGWVKNTFIREELLRTFCNNIIHNKLRLSRATLKFLSLVEFQTISFTSANIISPKFPFSVMVIFF